MAENFHIEGLDHVLKNMRGLPVKLQKTAMRRAGLQAMNIVRKAAAAGWKRVDDPATKNSQIWKKVKVKNFQKKFGIVTKVGIEGGAVSKTYVSNRRNQRSGRAGKSYTVESPDTFHWRFYELGTSRQPARPIMVPALVSNITNVTNKYVSVLTAEISKAIT
jgi:HK97 gp10 family phage protein